MNLVPEVYYVSHRSSGKNASFTPVTVAVGMVVPRCRLQRNAEAKEFIRGSSPETPKPCVPCACPRLGELRERVGVNGILVRAITN